MGLWIALGLLCIWTVAAMFLAMIALLIVAAVELYRGVAFPFLRIEPIEKEHGDKT